MDLKSYSLTQLKTLEVRIARQIERQQSACKTRLRRQLETLAREHGLALEDVFSPTVTDRIVERSAPDHVKAADTEKPRPARYRHPSNRDLAWSGRGRPPHWVTAWRANGGSMDALAIAAEKLAPRPRRVNLS
ncbi:H-NS histone family protein [Azoarcus sp. L1K30]|nr:H-NS histone family protein [Azoarcus sp. L1K30]